jgi:hypothetical protein
MPKAAHDARHRSLSARGFLLNTAQALRTLGCIGACCLILSSTLGALGTSQIQSFAISTIQVDNRNPAASDSNPGTLTLPLRTVNRAVQIALEFNRRDIPASILIHDGVYREAISIPKDGTHAPIAFRAAKAGRVVISGSDVWKGWAQSPGRPTFTHPWPNTWGLVAIPAEWPRVADIVRRREMVFIDGRLLQEVLNPQELREGTFYVDEAGKLLYVWPNGHVDPNTSTTEVALRPILFASSQRYNLTLSGLVFEHAATGLDGDAVLLDNVTNLVVEDAVFRWNNWGGFGIYGATNATARRNIANHNGGRGMAAWRVLDLKYNDNETSYNNWRGAWGDFHDWAMAGIKIMRVHGGTIQRHKAIGNQAYGLWLDFDNQHVTVEGGTLCSNLLTGGFLEASQGPIIFQGVTACLNGQIGLFTTGSQNATLENSILYGNGTAQFQVGGSLTRTVENWETGEVMALQAKNWSLCGNAIVGTSGTKYVFSAPNWEFFLSTLRSRRNVWWNGARAHSFRINSRTDLDFAGWRRAFGQDTDSVFADPRFAPLANWSFSLLPGSPWQKCTFTWPAHP